MPSSFGYHPLVFVRRVLSGFFYSGKFIKLNVYIVKLYIRKSIINRTITCLLLDIRHNRFHAL